MNHLLPISFLTQVRNCIYPKNELTGRRSFNFIPNFLINSIGHVSYNLECPFREQVGSGKTHRLVQNVFNQLVKAAKDRCSSSEKNRWEIRIKDDPQVNAYCFPGGKVIITTAMLRKLKEEATDDVSQEDLIAAVLAHEISHALAKHGHLKVQLVLILNIVLKLELLARIFSLLLIPILTEKKLQDLSRKWGNLLQLLFKWVGLYSLARHSQSCEFEADKFGIYLAYEANYNPKAAIKAAEIFLKIQKERYWFERVFDWFSFFPSHPSSEKRLEENKKTVNSLTCLNVPSYIGKRRTGKKTNLTQKIFSKPQLTRADTAMDHFIFFSKIAPLVITVATLIRNAKPSVRI